MCEFSNLDALEEIKEKSKYEVSNDVRFEVMLNEIKSTYEFLEYFDYLQSDKNILHTRSFKIIMPSGILRSALRTLLSIRLCCDHGNFSDANILLRKYRDDLFFYLYVVLGYYDTKATNQKETIGYEKNVEAWMNNNLSNLFITDVFRYIGEHPTLRQAVKKYNLHSVFNRIGEVLNNYTHGNGIKYYNKWLHAYADDDIEELTRDFPEQLGYFTVTYVFLLVLINPLFIMSTDYVDSLECGREPIPDSQYLVAPFVEDYISSKKHLLGDDCIKYLQDKTNMIFSE